MSDTFDPSFHIDDSTLSQREKGLSRIDKLKLEKVGGKYYLGYDDSVYSFEKSKRISRFDKVCLHTTRKIMRPGNNWYGFSSSSRSYDFGHAIPRPDYDWRVDSWNCVATDKPWWRGVWLIANESEDGKIYLFTQDEDKRSWNPGFYSLDGLEKVGSILDGLFCLDNDEDSSGHTTQVESSEDEECEYKELIDCESWMYKGINYIVNPDNGNVYDADKWEEGDGEWISDAPDPRGLLLLGTRKPNTKDGVLVMLDGSSPRSLKTQMINTPDELSSTEDQEDEVEEIEIEYVATIKKTLAERQEESLAAAKARGDYIDLESEEEHSTILVDSGTQTNTHGIKTNIEAIRIALGIDESPNMVYILHTAQMLMGVRSEGTIPTQIEFMQGCLGI